MFLSQDVTLFGLMIDVPLLLLPTATSRPDPSRPRSQVYFEVADATPEGFVQKSVLRKHVAEVSAMKFSPSGEFLASGGDESGSCGKKEDWEEDRSRRDFSGCICSPE